MGLCLWWCLAWQLALLKTTIPALSQPFFSSLPIIHLVWIQPRHLSIKVQYLTEQVSMMHSILSSARSLPDLHHKASVLDMRKVWPDWTALFPGSFCTNEWGKHIEQSMAGVNAENVIRMSDAI